MLKINNKKTFALVYVFFLVVFSFLPWEKPSTILSSGEGKVQLVLERSNGDQFERTIDLPDGPSLLKLSNQKVISFKKSDDHFLYVYSENISYLGSPKIIFSVLFSALVLTILIFYLIGLILRSEKLYPLFIHGAVLSIAFLGLFPGLFNYDSYAMLRDISNFETSEFHGLFFQSIIMSLFQLNPYPWTLTTLNIVCILGFLFHLSIIASELKVEKYYWICCFIFYLYPPNIVLTFMASRDPVSYWLFFVVTLEFYLSLAKQDFTKRRAIQLSLAFGLSCLFRPETVFVLIPYLIMIASIFYRYHWKWFAYLTLFPMITLLSKPIFNQTPIGHHKVSIAAYETTLLINPLSYILKNKYEELPPEINTKLGPFFKNENLIKYQVNNDIKPFHEGGVNFNRADAYPQFRSEALKIIFENPLLFIENRLKLAQTMLNFGGDNNYIGGGNEYLSEIPFFASSRTLFSFDEYKEFPFLRRLMVSFIELKESHPQFIYKSYLIPFLLLVASLLLAPRRSAYSKLLILYLMRTALVILTAPGGYFKYNYALWLFCLFAFPCVIWERRLTYDTKMSENTIEV